MLAATQSGAQATPALAERAQNALQGPAIAPRSPVANVPAASAAWPDRAVTLLTSDPQERAAFSVVRVHWAASALLLAAILSGFYMPLLEGTLGSVTHLTWELHLASWLLAFLGGN